MKERPILFSGPMVRAILDGSKTQTRRVVKPQFSTLWGSGVRRDEDRFSINVDIKERDGTWRWLSCPYGKPSDRLWVRETHYVESAGYQDGSGKFILYAATDEHAPVGVWTPSIHMPRWASRIDLAVKAVRVERLQEITVEDAYAEGVQEVIDHTGPVCFREEFRKLWDKINAKRGFAWKTNPWVWVVEFERA